LQIPIWLPAEGIGFVELVVEYIEKIDLFAADLAAVGTEDLGYRVLFWSLMRLVGSPG